jgi:hypothetical protein
MRVVTEGGWTGSSAALEIAERLLAYPSSVHSATLPAMFQTPYFVRPQIVDSREAVAGVHVVPWSA